MTNLKHLTIRLREKPGSAGAMIIDYLNKHPSTPEAFLVEVMSKLCLPYSLDPELPMSKDVARSCATWLEAEAKAIREKWGLQEENDSQATAIKVKDNKKKGELKGKLKQMFD